MFSTTQQEFIDTFIPVVLAENDYYIVYTNTTISSGYSYSVEPDIIIVASNKPITCISPYTFELNEDSTMYSIRTPNYSNSSMAVNTQRITQSTINGTLTINSYESIYSNCEYSCSIRYGDCNFLNSKSNLYSDATCFLLSLILLYLWFYNLFGRGSRK